MYTVSTDRGQQMVLCSPSYAQEWNHTQIEQLHSLWPSTVSIFNLDIWSLFPYNYLTTDYLPVQQTLTGSICAHVVNCRVDSLCLLRPSEWDNFRLLTSKEASQIKRSKKCWYWILIVWEWDWYDNSKIWQLFGLGVSLSLVVMQVFIHPWCTSSYIGYQ